MAFDTVCVVGLGYIGLPTAAMFATHGKQVIGVDVSERVVSTLRSGRIHIEEPGLEQVVKTGVEKDSLRPQFAPEPADVFIIAVPTPQKDDHSPNMGFVEAAARSLVPFLRPGNLVVLESTSPPGTTELLVPILEGSGLRVGEDVMLAHSPERVLPGKILQELIENDRVIGGVTREAAEAAAELYRTFVTGEILLTDATTAEMAKLMENTFRDVNIALANEFSRVGAKVGIDVNEAIRLANHHPRVNILNPGPGVGGHCIAVDPWFIVDAAPEESMLIRTARAVNDAQPDYVVSLVDEALEGIENPNVAILGVAYKAEVDDVRESPATAVIQALEGKRYQLRLHDTYAEWLSDGRRLEQDLEKVIGGADAIVILTDHRQYRELDPVEIAPFMNRRIVLDTRYCIDPASWRRAGFYVRQLGVGVAPAVVQDSPR